MSVHLKAVPPPAVASCEQEGRAVAARPGAAANTADVFAALLEGIFSAMDSSPKEEGKEKKEENFLPQQLEPGLEFFTLFCLPEMEASVEAIQLPEAVAGEPGLNLLLEDLLSEANTAEAVQPAEEPAGGGKEMHPVVEKSAAGPIFPQEGALTEAGKLPAENISGSLYAEEEYVAVDFPGSRQNNFPLAADGDLSSGVQAAKQKQQKNPEHTGARQVFARGSAEGGDQNHHLKTHLSTHSVLPAASHLQEGLPEGKPGQELYNAVPGELQDDPGGQLTPSSESNTGKNTPIVSLPDGYASDWRTMLSGNKNTPLVSLPEQETKELETAPAGDSLGKAQDRNSAAGQENRYPVFFGTDEEAAFSAGENLKAAPGGKAAFFPTAHPAEQDYSQKIMEQIVERISYLYRAGEQELRLKLEPEFLGEVLIRVRRLKGVLSGEIITQHLAVKELLEGQLETLRQRFQQVNLEMARFQVFVRDEGQQGFAFAREHRGDSLSPVPGGAPRDDVSGEMQALPLELWEGKSRVNYLV